MAGGRGIKTLGNPTLGRRNSEHCPNGTRRRSRDQLIGWLDRIRHDVRAHHRWGPTMTNTGLFAQRRKAKFTNNLRTKAGNSRLERDGKSNRMSTRD